MNGLLAQVPNTFNVPTVGNTIANQYTSVTSITGQILNIAFWAGVALAIVFLIIGGVKYASSGGDKMAAQAAKQTVTNATIGFIIVVAFRALAQVALNLLVGNTDIGNYTTPGF